LEHKLRGEKAMLCLLDPSTVKKQKPPHDERDLRAK
jgi:hypothetical protein